MAEGTAEVKTLTNPKITRRQFLKDTKDLVIPAAVTALVSGSLSAKITERLLFPEVSIPKIQLKEPKAETVIPENIQEKIKLALKGLSK